jgi:hypothetical protein
MFKFACGELRIKTIVEWLTTAATAKLDEKTFVNQRTQ